MNNETPIVESAVIQDEKSTLNLSLATLNMQETNFKGQLEQVRSEITKLQQQFEILKVKGIKLEGALESLQILRASFSK